MVKSGGGTRALCGRLTLCLRITPITPPPLAAGAGTEFAFKLSGCPSPVLSFVSASGPCPIALRPFGSEAEATRVEEEPPIPIKACRCVGRGVDKVNGVIGERGGWVDKDQGVKRMGG